MLHRIMICTMRTWSSQRWNRIPPQMAENAKPGMLEVSEANKTVSMTAGSGAPSLGPRTAAASMAAQRATAAMVDRAWSKFAPAIGRVAPRSLPDGRLLSGAAGFAGLSSYDVGRGYNFLAVVRKDDDGKIFERVAGPIRLQPGCLPG